MKYHHHVRTNWDSERSPWSGVVWFLGGLGLLGLSVKLYQTSQHLQLDASTVQEAPTLDTRHEVQIAESHGLVSLFGPLHPGPSSMTLFAPLSGTSCVEWKTARYRVVEDKVKVERKEKKKRRDGSTSEVRTKAPSYVQNDILIESDERRCANFRVGTVPLEGRVEVDEMTWENNSRFEPSEGGNQRTVGFRFVEKYVPTGKNVYAYGVLGARGLEPYTRWRSHVFVSDKSPATLAQEIQWESRMVLVGSSVCTAIGVFVIISVLTSNKW